jgi:hypothetical protein
MRTKLLIILGILYLHLNTNGQTLNYQSVDSITYLQYVNAQWDNLLITGKQANKEGISYRNLSLRMGLAAFTLHNYSKAILHYKKALNFYSYDADASNYITACNLYLNRQELATFTARKLEKNMQKDLLVSYPKIIKTVDLEGGLKFTNSEVRLPAQYYRLGIQSQLSSRLSIINSVSFFNQQYAQPPSGQNMPQNNFGPKTIPVTDFEYYAKITGVINNKSLIKIAYTYNNSVLGQSISTVNLVTLAYKYYFNYIDLQGEITAGNLSDNSFKQFTLSSTIFPKGNTNFYLTLRASYRIDSTNKQFNCAPTLGFKAFKKCWIETNITLGEIKNYLENDALYIYNAIDKSKYKLLASGIFPLNKKLTLRLNYTLEQKTLYQIPDRQNNQNNNYIQQSLITGITWKI